MTFMHGKFQTKYVTAYTVWFAFIGIFNGKTPSTFSNTDWQS